MLSSLTARSLPLLWTKTNARRFLHLNESTDFLGSYVIEGGHKRMKYRGDHTGCGNVVYIVLS